MSKNNRVIHSKYFYGKEIPERDLQEKRISYMTLANAFDCILNNEIINIDIGYWEIVNGEIDYDNEYPTEIFQYFIIDSNGYQILSDYTDEIVFYNDELDMYLWGIDFWGTSWAYVSTEIEIDV